jgi:hypothetical protein
MEGLKGGKLWRKLEVLRCLPTQNDPLLQSPFSGVGRRTYAPRNSYVNDQITISPTGISLSHDSLFSHCDLTELPHIIKVDSCMHKSNYQC